MTEHFIDGKWRSGTGSPLSSTDPATGKILWQGHAATSKEVNEAVAAAKTAFISWSSLDIQTRIKYLEAFGNALSTKSDFFSEGISKETGKPFWETKTETAAMLGKIAASIDAYKIRCPEVTKEQPTGSLVTRHRPHGVMAIFGPYNFPGHLPNGHIIPALLAGNTVIFKPSELTPMVAQLTLECWEEAKLPAGVLNLIQGGKETGKLLSQHSDIDGILFTGSWQTGKILAEQMASAPEKILALEMGGNNPYVIGTINDLQAAAYLTIHSAFITSGQRCTCARRLIVPKGEAGDKFLETLVAMAKTIKIGPYTDTPEPFIGPLISEQAAESVLQKQKTLLSQGGISLLPLTQLPLGPAFLSPGIMDITQIVSRPDEEIFGPFLQVIRVDDLQAAIRVANKTQYGLSAGILTDSQEEYETFLKNVQAGVINWNVPLTGASSLAPFGGLKHSGNNRPSAFYAADYCAYPVTSLEKSNLKLPENIVPGISL